MSLTIKRCLKCGATVEVLHDCTCENCGVKCCGEEMRVQLPNTVDASVEKHLPVVEVNGNEVELLVNKRFSGLDGEEISQMVCLSHAKTLEHWLQKKELNKLKK